MSRYKGDNSGGKGNPPIKGQFREGNKLGGRKKNSSSINAALKKVFSGKVDIKINGVTVSVPAIEALALRTLQQGLTGPFAANEAVRALAEKLGPRDQPALDGSRLTVEEMRIMLPLMAKLMGKPPPEPFKNPFQIDAPKSPE